MLPKAAQYGQGVARLPALTGPSQRQPSWPCSPAPGGAHRPAGHPWCSAASSPLPGRGPARLGSPGPHDRVTGTCCTALCFACSLRHLNRACERVESGAAPLGGHHGRACPGRARAPAPSLGSASAAVWRQRRRSPGTRCQSPRPPQRQPGSHCPGARRGWQSLYAARVSRAGSHACQPWLGCPAGQAAHRWGSRTGR